MRRDISRTIKKKYFIIYLLIPIVTRIYLVENLLESFCKYENKTLATHESSSISIIFSEIFSLQHSMNLQIILKIFSKNDYYFITTLFF